MRGETGDAKYVVSFTAVFTIVQRRPRFPHARGCEPNIKAEEIAAIRLSGAIDRPKVKATALAPHDLYRAPAVIYEFPLHFFSDGEKEGYAVYDMFIEMKPTDITDSKRGARDK